MKPSAYNTLQELRRKGADGATTAELMMAGGRNFPARIHELRHEFGYTILEQRIRQGSHLFTLVEEDATVTVAEPRPLGVDARLEKSETEEWAEARGYEVVTYIPGAYHCCDSCAYVWHERGWPTHCPACKRGSHWIASHWTRGAAESYVPLAVAEAKAARQPLKAAA